MTPAVRASIEVRQAIADGRLVRQSCQRCGNAKVEAHHEDYSKPLEVVWLCRKHHRWVHHGESSSRVTMARKQAGLTQVELAVALNVTPRTIGNWESGTRELRGKYLRAVAAATGKPLAWFFEEVAA